MVREDGDGSCCGTARRGPNATGPTTYGLSGEDMPLGPFRALGSLAASGAAKGCPGGAPRSWRYILPPHSEAD